MFVLPLGIASGTPARGRHVTSTALVLDSSKWVLLDCGDGTLDRVLARPELPLSKLAAVFVTHAHGDHLLGLPALLNALDMSGRSSELPVVVGKVGAAWVSATEAAGLIDARYKIEIFSPYALRTVGEALGLEVSSSVLNHRTEAHGYRFQAPAKRGTLSVAMCDARGLTPKQRGLLAKGQSVGDVHPSDVMSPSTPGASLAYCTDTTPCVASEVLAENVDLLVHEATYLITEERLANDHMHSCAIGAGAVARNARAKRLVLTHFSGRYESLIPHQMEAEEAFDGEVISATEGTRIDVG